MSAASEDRDQAEAVQHYHTLLDQWLLARKEAREVLDFIGLRAPDGYFKDDDTLEALNKAFGAAVAAVTRNRNNP